MTRYICPKCNDEFKTCSLEILYTRICFKCGNKVIPIQFEYPIKYSKVKEIIKEGGEIWVVHKYDKDSWPSNPHAHNENKEKLNLYTGDVYSILTKELTRKIKPKILAKIQKKSKHFKKI